MNPLFFNLIFSEIFYIIIIESESERSSYVRR